MGDSKRESQSTNELADTKWKLYVLVSEEGDKWKSEADTLYNLQFLSDGTVLGSKLCNFCTGEYETSISTALYFDLSLLKNEFKNTYRDSGIILINIYDYKKKYVKGLRYEFED